MQENKSLKTRNIILKLADYLKVKGIGGVALNLGENPNKLYAWIKNGNIGDTGCILGKYPNISKAWLETGEGEMLVQPYPYPHGVDKFKQFAAQMEANSLAEASEGVYPEEYREILRATKDYPIARAAFLEIIKLPESEHFEFYQKAKAAARSMGSGSITTVFDTEKPKR